DSGGPEDPCRRFRSGKPGGASDPAVFRESTFQFRGSRKREQHTDDQKYIGSVKSIKSITVSVHSITPYDLPVLSPRLSGIPAGKPPHPYVSCLQAALPEESDVLRRRLHGFLLYLSGQPYPEGPPVRSYHIPCRRQPLSIS